MEGIYTVVCDFLSQAIIIGCVIGVFVRCGNIFIRAISGKEDFI